MSERDRHTGPRYRIVRIEPASNDVTPARDCAPPVALLSEYRRSRPIPSRQEYAELAERHGFQLAPSGSNRHGYDLIAYCYTSPRKDGVGRSVDQLRRIPARRISE